LQNSKFVVEKDHHIVYICINADEALGLGAMPGPMVDHRVNHTSPRREASLLNLAGVRPGLFLSKIFFNPPTLSSDF
jgi:hypothetical protein